jgi:hypothetical protein
MTKKEFIWLVIRFFGLVTLMLSVRPIVNTILTFCVTLPLFPAEDASEAVVLVSLLPVILDGVFKLLIVVYLLFFGKTLFTIVNRTSTQALDAALVKPDYTEILIRFLGLWWLWLIAGHIFRLIYSLCMALILHHPDWLMSNVVNEPTKSTTLETFTQLNSSLYPLQMITIVGLLSNILIYSILAWYFLKHGRYFINLFNRLWLDLTHH